MIGKIWVGPVLIVFNKQQEIPADHPEQRVDNSDHSFFSYPHNPQIDFNPPFKLTLCTPRSYFEQAYR